MFNYMPLVTDGRAEMLSWQATVPAGVSDITEGPGSVRRLFIRLHDVHRRLFRYRLTDLHAGWSARTPSIQNIVAQRISHKKVKSSKVWYLQYIALSARDRLLTRNLYHLWSGGWLAWANDTAAHYAAIHCPNQRSCEQLDLRCSQQTYHSHNTLDVRHFADYSISLKMFY